MATTEKRVVSLTLDAKQFNTQIKGIRDQLGGINDTAKRTAKSLEGLSSVLGIVAKATAAAYAVQRVTAFIGKIQDMNNVLRSVTDTSEDFAAVQSKLFVIANKTGAAIGDTTQAYARIARALQGTGKSSQDALLITERLNKALLVSGASAGEAASTLTQFSQALQSGKLQGDEFRSLTENAPLVIAAIAQVSGQGRAALKELAKEGKLTADVLVEALAGDAGKAIDAAANGFQKTIPQAINIAINNFIALINGSSSVISALGLIAKAIILVSENLVALGVVIAILARGAIVSAIAATAKSIIALGVSITATLGPARVLPVALAATGPAGAVAAVGITAASTALAVFRALLITTGVGALLVLLGLLAQKLIEVAERTSTVSQFFSVLGNETAIAAGEATKFANYTVTRALIPSFVGLNDKLDEAGKKFDDFIDYLTESSRKAIEDAEASEVAADAKRALAEAVREANTALLQGNAAFNADMQNMRTETALINEQIEAYKKGGKAGQERAKNEQEVGAAIKKVFDESLKFRKAANDPNAYAAATESARQAEVQIRALAAAKQALDAVDDPVKKARTPKVKKEKEYETLPQILADIKLKAEQAKGALDAFSTGGSAALEAYNLAQERRAAVDKIVEDAQKNKLAQTPAALEALKKEVDLIVSKTQADEQERKNKIDQAAIDADINRVLAEKNILVEAGQVLQAQGVQAYEDFLAKKQIELDVQTRLGAAYLLTNGQLSENAILMIEAATAAAKAGEANVKAANDLAEANKASADIFKRFIDGVVSGSVKFKDAIKEMLRALLTLIIQQLIFNALAGSNNTFLQGVGTAGGGKKSAPAGGGPKSSAIASNVVSQVAAYGGGKSQSEGGMRVIINNNASGVEVTASQRDDGQMIEIAVERVAGMIARGGNKVANALEKTYGVNRGFGAFS